MILLLFFLFVTFKQIFTLQNRRAKWRKSERLRKERDGTKGSLDTDPNSPTVSIDVASNEVVSTPSTSPEPIETKENESPLSLSPNKIKSNGFELSNESLITSPNHLFGTPPKSNFPISSLIAGSGGGGGLPNRNHNSDFLTNPSLMSTIRHPFYLSNQSSVSFFERNAFLRDFSIPSHFVPPFNSIKSSLFNAFANEK